MHWNIFENSKDYNYYSNVRHMRDFINPVRSLLEEIWFKMNQAKPVDLYLKLIVNLFEKFQVLL